MPAIKKIWVFFLFFHEDCWVHCIYETCGAILKNWSMFSQNYYMIGRDKSRTCWRALKIDRSEPTELNIVEDPTTYSEQECYELLRRIHEGNMPVGGLKLITVCYGIIGTICCMFQTCTNMVFLFPSFLD